MGLLFVCRKLLPLFSLLFAISISPLATASVDTGLTWLKSQQRDDGSFSSDNSQATDIQSTVEALLALHQFSNLESPRMLAASGFLLSQQSSAHLDLTANLLRLQTISTSNFPVSTGQISNYKGFSGGYGDYPGYDDSVSTSAILLYAIAGHNLSGSVSVPELINYLLIQQGSDYGWSEEPNLSSTYVTALSSRALQAHRLQFDITNQIQLATQYLLQRQDVGGGWGSNLDTAIVLLAIIPVVSDPALYKNAVDSLMASQLPNGSWGNDIFTTALALQVLHLKDSTLIGDGTGSDAAIEVKNISSAKTQFDAYEELNLSGVIQNNSSIQKELVVEAKVFNSSGDFVGYLSITNGSPTGESAIRIPPGENVELTYSWLTGNYPPGDYHIVLTAYSQGSLIFAGSQDLHIQIKPTLQVPSLRLIVDPASINQGIEQDIKIKAALDNRSNVSGEMTIQYDLVSPEGSIIFSGESVVIFQHQEEFLTVDLGVFHSQLLSSGAYTLSVRGINGVQPDSIQSGVLNVIPNVSININQSISPSVVLPSEGTRVRVEIKLEGVNVI